MPEQQDKVPAADQLHSALNMMLTFFGMDEDETNKTVFDAARKAINNSDMERQRMSNTEHEIGILESLDAAKDLPDAKRDRFLIRHNDDGEFGQFVGWLYRDGGDPCTVSGAPVWVWRPLKDLLATTGHTIVRSDHLTEVARLRAEMEAVIASATRMREALSTYAETYNAYWERGMDILEPLSDKALADFDAALTAYEASKGEA